MFSLHWFCISLFVGWKNNWNINWIGFLELYTSRNGRVVRTYCVFNLLGSFLSPTKIGKNQFFLDEAYTFVYAVPFYLITQMGIDFFRISFFARICYMKCIFSKLFWLIGMGSIFQISCFLSNIIKSKKWQTWKITTL